MYSDDELDAAVAAGALSAQSAATLRAFVAHHRAAPAADEEQFRLLTGFNDIFVSIAAALMLVALGFIGGAIFGALAVAAASWGLAEHFTRRRRMALPSIVLLVSFSLAVFTLGGLCGKVVADGLGRSGGTVGTALGAVVAMAATFVHWRRFHVPVTVAVGALAGIAAAIAAAVAWVPGLGEAWQMMVFVAGLTLFAGAMWWDMSDPARITRRSDVAFWLHLAAAPMIVHPVFSALGLLRGDGAASTAAGAFALYVVLAWVALVVDRRALLVSALAYVLYAISTLVAAAGAAGVTFSLTALLVGSGLLLLSAFWHAARQRVLRVLPGKWRARLPAA